MAAAHEQFNGIRQVAPVCTPPNTCFLGPPKPTTQTASRSVQPFLHSSRQSVVGHIGAYPSPSKLPLDVGDLDSHLTRRGSLTQPNSASQTASRSVQPFFAYLTVGTRYILQRADPAPPPQKGAEPPIFGPCLLWPSGWMDEAGTCHGGRPQPRRLCVRWGPSPPPQKGAESPSPIFGPFL